MTATPSNSWTPEAAYHRLGIAARRLAPETVVSREKNDRSPEMDLAYVVALFDAGAFCQSAEGSEHVLLQTIRSEAEIIALFSIPDKFDRLEPDEMRVEFQEQVTAAEDKLAGDYGAPIADLLQRQRDDPGLADQLKTQFEEVLECLNANT